MDNPLSKRVVVPNDCFPRRCYFHRRILSIVERIERILDHEFKSPNLSNSNQMSLRQHTCTPERRNIKRMTLRVNDYHPEIHLFGHSKLLNEEFTAQLVVRKECKTPVKQDALTPEVESLCAVRVVVVEFDNDIQKFKTHLREAKEKISNTRSLDNLLQHVVIAIITRPEHHVTLKHVHVTVKEELVSDRTDFDVDKQIVLVPCKRPHSPSASHSRPLSGEPPAKQSAVSLSGHERDIKQHPTNVPVSLTHTNPTQKSLSPQGSPPSSPTLESASPLLLAPHSPSKYLQPKLEAMQIEPTRIATRSMTSSSVHQHLSQHTCADEHVAVESRTKNPNSQTVQAQKNTPCEWTLYRAVSYQLETKLIDDIVVAIETLLVDIKSRRDKKAGQPLFTVLDKLLFEVRGLYNQSITRTAIEKKTKADTQRTSTDLANKLLTLDHVRGCGHIYGTLNIHIDDGVDEKKKDKVKEKIKEVVEQNSALRGPYDYVISMIKGQPTMFGHNMVICSA